MKRKYLIAILIVLILLIIYISYKQINSNIATTINSNDAKTNIENHTNNNSNNTTNQNNIQTKENKSSKTEIKEDTNTFTKNNEENIIKYFQDLDEELTNYNNENENLGKKIKAKFVTCIDFLFYDKEINGITFKELTNKTKLKILEIAISIDTKIDSKFPNYKEDISNKYQDIKNKIIEKYLEITTNICKENENLCNTAKENFQSLKENFGITWNLIKELVGSSTTKLKDWYEIWRYN